MDEMKDGASSWAHEVKTYEMEKRRVLDEGFLRPPAMKLTSGKMKSQERVFDPLLQRYRDNETEYKQRVAEETERINHLNRAMDIQIVREQPHHILHHESRFDKLAPGKDPTRQPHKERKTIGPVSMPVSQQDFNIVSNLPHDVHHWNRPDQRPRCVEKTGTQRKIHASRIRDFNIVNNRYPKDHEARVQKEKELNVAEAVHKYSTQRKFDPVVQQYNDPRDEETAKHCDDARDVEVQLRAQDKIPPSYKGRHTEFYNAVSNEVYNPQMLKYLQTVENERKDRYQNRHIFELNCHVQDVKGDHIAQARKLNKVAPERFMEHEKGYDFITNKKYGHGPKEQVHYGEGYPQKRMTPWEQIEHSHSLHGRASSTPALPSSAAAEQRSSDPAVSSTPARNSRRGGHGSREDGAVTPAASQRSQASNRSMTLSEAGGRALSQTSASAAALREPPGATRPIPRSSSTPNMTSLTPVPEMSASAVQTRKLPPPAAFGESLQMTRGSPPPAPVIPGSPGGSCYSRPSQRA